MRNGPKAIPWFVPIALTCLAGFGPGCQPSPPLIQAEENSEQTRGPLNGYYEITGLLGGQAGWSDPESPLIGWLGELELLELDSQVQPGERIFMLFDRDGVVILMLDYDIGADTLYYRDPGENPIWGLAPTQVDQAWEYRTPMEVPPSSPISISVPLVVRCAEGDDAQPGTLSLQLEETFLAVQDLPAIPQEGKEAVAAGTTASWVASSRFSLEASESPFALFPGAQILPAPSEE